MFALGYVLSQDAVSFGSMSFVLCERGNSREKANFV